MKLDGTNLLQFRVQVYCISPSIYILGIRKTNALSCFKSIWQWSVFPVIIWN